MRSTAMASRSSGVSKQIGALHADRNAATRELGDDLLATEVTAIEHGDIAELRSRLLALHRLDGIGDERSFLLSGRCGRLPAPPARRRAQRRVPAARR